MEPLDGKNYAKLLKHAIPHGLNNLNLRSHYLIEDHASCHFTNDAENAKRELGLKRLENFPSSRLI